MEIKITKAHLTKDNRLKISYQELSNGDEPEKDEIERNSSRLAHPDLVNAFADLRIHLATITEQGEYSQFLEDKELLEKFKATHISIGGDDGGDHEGVTISGQKKLTTGKVLNMVAPFTKFAPERSDYSHSLDLDMTVKVLLSEISQYLNGTKYAPSNPNQLDLFGEDDHGSMTAEEEAPKRKRKSKAAEASEQNPEVATME